MIRPVVLVILDGWGIAPVSPGNAITQAKTSNLKRYWAAYPHCQLLASGESVGLPHNEKGNSEAGHLNIGAGRVIFQDLPRINYAIADGTFFNKLAFKEALVHVLKYNSKLHLIGLVGQGGVHSSLEHLLALLTLTANQKVKSVFLHLFTDGRDSPPDSSLRYLNKINEVTKNLGVGKIATLCGRYYAMDRDLRWERTQIAYEALVEGKGEFYNSYQQAIEASYAKKISDEFLKPVILDKQGLIDDNDAVIFFNFRIDRPRQLTKAFVLSDFEKLKIMPVFDPYAEKYGLKSKELPNIIMSTFQRKKFLKNLYFVTMTEYEKGLPASIAFPPEMLSLTLAGLISDRGLRQLHLTETEKERFVTYYFNGQREKPFPGEDWLTIPSPKVATYDLQPEMSARLLSETCLNKLSSGTYDFILINFANPDMVGHTGNLQAGIQACETVDECLGRIVEQVTNKNGVCLVTADHGNIEEMINLTTGQVDTEHSTNPVPFVFISLRPDLNKINLLQGSLTDIAPTILNLFNIEKPESMTGHDLLK